MGFEFECFFEGGGTERVGKLSRWEGPSGENLRIKDILSKGMVGSLTNGLPTVGGLTKGLPTLAMVVLDGTMSHETEDGISGA